MTLEGTPTLVNNSINASQTARAVNDFSVVENLLIPYYQTVSWTSGMFSERDYGHVQGLTYSESSETPRA